jgi:hypothetical protein
MFLAALIGLAAVAIAGVCVEADTATPAGSGMPAQSVADTNGNLRVPEGYRQTYEHLGTWSVLSDDGTGAKELHVVYASPGAADAYRKAGQFADGAVLVKEVFETATEEMTTGTVSRENKLKGWFVMVKDGKHLHPGNKLWGDGWGWSWFDAGNSEKTTSTDYKTDCQACHVPAQAQDWIYVQGYPALKR